MNAWRLVAAIAVAIVAALNLADTVRRVPPPPRAPESPPTDIVVRHEARFAGVAVALRRHGVQGTLGYIADLPAEQLAADASAMEDNFLSQFALVPWVLDARATDRPWAIANLRGESAPARVPANFRIVEDFGHGVLLLQQTKP